MNDPGSRGRPEGAVEQDLQVIDRPHVRRAVFALLVVGAAYFGNEFGGGSTEEARQDAAQQRPG